MRADVRREEGVILDRDVARERDAVGEDVVVSYLAVVRDVDSDHEEVSTADARHRALAARAVQRRVLANQVVVADDERARLTSELNVLRLAAHGRVLVDAVALAERREALDDRVRAYLAARAHAHVVLDDGVRADAHAVCEFGARAYYGCRVYRHKSPKEVRMVHPRPPESPKGKGGPPPRQRLTPTAREDTLRPLLASRTLSS